MPDQMEMPEPSMADEMRSAVNEGDGQDDGTFFLNSADLPEGHECKPGDKLELTVVGMDKDGDYEVKLSGVNKKKAGLAEELRGAVNAKPDESMSGGDKSAY